MAMPDVLQQMKQSDVTVHGFRSTFRDWAAFCERPGAGADVALRREAQ